MTNIIIKNGTRILRPQELKLLYGAIPKVIDKTRFEVALYTGARYVELQKIAKHPEFLYENDIKMATKKVKAQITERYIHLNENGVRAIKMLLSMKKNKYCSLAGWDQNLKRWAKIAGLDPTGISAKTTRKTWESYLIASYPSNVTVIFLSQGHSEMTSLTSYLMIPFTDQEKEDIKYYTQGWIK